MNRPAAETAPVSRHRPYPRWWRHGSFPLELASIVLVPSAIVGLNRVFEGTDTLGPLIVASVMSSLLAILCRRIGLALWLSAVISAACLAQLIMHRYAPGTLSYGMLPTSDTWSMLGTLIESGAQEFRRVRAPTEATPGFVAASLIGVWTLAFFTDWGANRLPLAFEPVLPAGLLFIFASVLGSGDHELQATAAFAAGVALWALTRRYVTIGSLPWLNEERARGTSATVAAGAAVLAVTVIAGLAFGPRLPGVDAPELYNWRDSSNPVRRVETPFISIGSRLVEQSDQEMFTVTVNEPQYWRLVGLDNYADFRWSTRGSFQPRSGSLPSDTRSAATGQLVRQHFSITNLGEIWLPAAYIPTHIANASQPVTWNGQISSLTVDSSQQASDGMTYTVESTVPNFHPDELRGAGSVQDRELLEHYTMLPDDLTPMVRELAREIAGDLPNTYEQMMALQRYFHTYDYSLQLSPRRGDPVEQFLTEQIGFCQQFSGTFALMARSLGVPARVAVGFTWGESLADQPNTYRVSGRHAHAWPEIYFEGYGWVAFEPTPGRGAPGAAHTGLLPQQEHSPGASAPNPATTTTTTAPGGGSSTTVDPLSELIPDFDVAEIVPVLTDDQNRPWKQLVAAVVILSYLIAMPVAWRLWRHHRVAKADSEASAIAALWENQTDLLDRLLGLRRPATATHSEWAERLISERRLPASELRRLASAATMARYAPAGSTPPYDLGDVRADADAITAVVYQRSSWWRRWLMTLNPLWVWRALRLGQAG